MCVTRQKCLQVPRLSSASVSQILLSSFVFSSKKRKKRKNRNLVGLTFATSEHKVKISFLPRMINPRDVVANSCCQVANRVVTRHLHRRYLKIRSEITRRIIKKERKKERKKSDNLFSGLVSLVWFETTRQSR